MLIRFRARCLAKQVWMPSCCGRLFRPRRAQQLRRPAWPHLLQNTDAQGLACSLRVHGLACSLRAQGHACSLRAREPRSALSGPAAPTNSSSLCLPLPKSAQRSVRTPLSTQTPWSGCTARKPPCSSAWSRKERQRWKRRSEIRLLL